MRKVAVSLNLADILRERIDECAKFKRNAKVSDDVLARFGQGKSLSDEEAKQVVDAFLGRILELFLDSKQGLVIPDDAVHRVGGETFKNVDALGITLAYQDFYAYQFVDHLNDIVRRAFRVRDVFTRQRPPGSVMKLCREAYQSYLYANHTASVALLRSVVETTLKDRLGSDIGALRALNDAAVEKGLYGREIWLKVKQLNKEASAYIHDAAKGKSPSEAKNLEMIGLAQEIIQSLVA